MANARPLRDVFADLAGDHTASSGDVLAAGGHPDLPDGLVAEAVVNYADTAPIEVAAHLAPFVMANSPVPLGPEVPDEPPNWLDALATAPEPAPMELDAAAVHEPAEHAHDLAQGHDPAAFDHDFGADHDFGRGAEPSHDHVGHHDPAHVDPAHVDPAHLDPAHLDAGPTFHAVLPDPIVPPDAVEPVEHHHPLPPTEHEHDAGVADHDHLDIGPDHHF
jgi:hypothetical protein